jgi:hypothetical protein
MSGLVRVAAQHDVVDLLSHAPDLEELFLTYYSADPARSAASPPTLQEARDGR